MSEDKLEQMIDTLSEELGIDSSDILELFDTFIKEMGEEIFRLKIAYQKGDFLAMKNISHNIKGVTANLRFQEMHAESKFINDKLKAEEFNDLYSHIEALVNHYSTFKNVFNNYLNK